MSDAEIRMYACARVRVHPSRRCRYLGAMPDRAADRYWVDVGGAQLVEVTRLEAIR